MKKKLLLTISILWFFTNAHAQESVNSAGGNASGINGNVSYSIGQIFSKSVSNANNSIIEGVQQPFEITTLGVDDFATITMEMKVYPNPTTNNIYLKVVGLPLRNLQYHLFDTSGRVLGSQALKEEVTSIDLSAKSSGMYLLIVSDVSQKLKTFKIIKK